MKQVEGTMKLKPGIIWMILEIICIELHAFGTISLHSMYFLPHSVDAP